MNRVGIIDYGLCNLDSVGRAIEEIGGTPRVVSVPEHLTGLDRYVLPGVGAFPDAMSNLRLTGLDQALGERIRSSGAPLLGICLGMQLLASEGVEVAPCAGLGWIPGRVPRMQAAAGERIPHIGWNGVDHKSHPLFEGIPSGSDFYFVHSYSVIPVNPTHGIAMTAHAGGFVSAIADGPIVGVQFHPEKSQRLGLRLLANFLAWRGGC